MLVQELLVLVLAAVTAASTPPLPQRARQLFHEGRLDEAGALYAVWLAAHPDDVDALAGAGFVALARADIDGARARFERARSIAPRDVDASFGLGLALLRAGLPAEARSRLAEALVLDPSRIDVSAALAEAVARAPGPPPPARRSATLDLVARARGRALEVRDAAGAWQPLFVKGINLGTALPGRHPGEFPDKQTYVDWLQEMAAVGINAIRVYTIHPPWFYEALDEHNRRAPRPLRLIHGAWTEPPPHDDFDDAAWFGAWIDEMHRAVDVVHGRANLAARPGHASGLYRADVSPWVLGYVIGREWEPFNVVAFNRSHPGSVDWDGRFVSLRGGHATELVLARAMDELVAYEQGTYNAQRPVAFTNWPTLDPLEHPTEATKAEEMALRRRLALPLAEGERLREYDNDAVGLDMEKYAARPGFEAGLFAAYHAYPYYPDFIGLDPGYGAGIDHLGPNNYIAYLHDLVRHHRRHPLVVAEFGVPSSRLVAHWQPQGMTHGGQNEREQGEQDARLWRNVYDAGCAGGVLFAWIDEWFKKNWLVLELEEPLERDPLWYNAMDAEENYGLVGIRPGEEAPAITIDGCATDWETIPIHAAEEGLALKLLADEGWLHLGIFFESPGGAETLLVGLDTYDVRLGDHRLPFGLKLSSEAGLEFVIRFEPDRAAVYADEPYDLFRHRHDRPYRSIGNARGRFVVPMTESNRSRIGRDGTLFPAHRQEIGWLRRGTQDRASAAFDSLAEWERGPGFVEARIPWGLINVTDPSSRRVVHDPPGHTEGGAGTLVTDGVRACVLRTTVEGNGKPRVTASLPAVRGGTLPLPPLFTWAPWEAPHHHSFRKAAFDIVGRTLAALPDAPLGTSP